MPELRNLVVWSCLVVWGYLVVWSYLAVWNGLAVWSDLAVWSELAVCNELAVWGGLAVWNELAVVDGLVLRGDRIVIPDGELGNDVGNMRQWVVELGHEGHQGTDAIKRLLRTRLWFPGMGFPIAWLLRSFPLRTQHPSCAPSSLN